MEAMRRKGRPPRNIQLAAEWAKTCRLIQSISRLKPEEIEQILKPDKDADTSGRTWRNWCTAKRTPSREDQEKVLKQLGWAGWQEDPRQSRKLRQTAAKAISRALELTGAWQDFCILTGVDTGTPSDRLGMLCYTLLEAIANGISDRDDQTGLEKIEQTCRNL